MPKGMQGMHPSNKTEINTYLSPIQHSSLLDFLKPSTHPIIYTYIHTHAHIDYNEFIKYIQ